ncbi:MAG: nucleotidyltransferase domain-containing protein [Planctomycetia bacterium]|nr:nucleotidyltransferase domain-containing protein [Planctomycetia bacterium]
MFEEYLQRIEQENNIKILYCCEAGSRAWKFPSPDSDYDIRFVYVHPVEWYLQLTPGRDTMEWFSEDRVLDFSGWELRKALNLFAVCNPAFNEQLDSPIIYRKDPRFLTSLRDLVSNYFLPIRAFYHYFTIAHKMAAIHPIAESIGVKAFFYIIRPLLACRFILDHHVQPPTIFADLYNTLDIPELIRAQLGQLIEQKKTTKEKAQIRVPAELVQYTDQIHQEMGALASENAKANFPTTEPADRKPLETLFQNCVLKNQ